MKHNIYDDLYRYTGKRGWILLIRYIIFTLGFRYTFFYRKVQNSSFIFCRIFWNILLRQTMLRTGIQIPPQVQIGAGFRIAHFGHIVINPASIIGKNFNIAQGVIIGSTEGRMKGVPIIGDNVCIQPNAIVVGKIKIGNDVLIAPNSFVNYRCPGWLHCNWKPC